MAFDKVMSLMTPVQIYVNNMNQLRVFRNCSMYPHLIVFLRQKHPYTAPYGMLLLIMYWVSQISFLRISYGPLNPINFIESIWKQAFWIRDAKYQNYQDYQNYLRRLSAIPQQVSALFFTSTTVSIVTALLLLLLMLNDNCNCHYNFVSTMITLVTLGLNAVRWLLTFLTLH